MNYLSVYILSVKFRLIEKLKKKSLVRSFEKSETSILTLFETHLDPQLSMSSNQAMWIIKLSFLYNKIFSAHYTVELDICFINLLMEIHLR